MCKYWKRNYDAQGRSFLEEVPVGDIVADSPTVIFLPGIKTTTGNKRSISGNAKQIEALIHAIPFARKPKLYTQSNTRLSQAFSYVAYSQKCKGRITKGAQDFARAIILPLVTHQNRPLAPSEAAARLRNLTLVAYSVGTVLAQEIYNAALDMMIDAGYRKNAARTLLQEIVLVSIGAISSPLYESDRFTTVTLAARNDRIINLFAHDLHKLTKQYTAPLSIQVLSETSTLVITDVPNKRWEWKKAADGACEKKTIRPNIPAWLLIRDYHELAHYITLDDEHCPYSKIAWNALTNAIERQERKTALSLLEPNVLLTAPESQAYMMRLSKALDAENFRHLKEEKQTVKTALVAC